MKTEKEYYFQIASFCDYQERCSSEVYEKMKLVEVPYSFSENIVNRLLNENLLNDERFAESYARGKFRIKHWGKTKIKYRLKQKMIPNTYIIKALSQISSEEYSQSLKDILAKYKKTHLGESEVLLVTKMYKYAISKGYENDLTWEIINDLKKEI
jgi:regulatory protein